MAACDGHARVAELKDKNKKTIRQKSISGQRRNDKQLAAEFFEAGGYIWLVSLLKHSELLYRDESSLTSGFGMK